MIVKNVIEIIKLIAKERFVRFTVIIVTLCVIILGVFLSPIAAVLIYCSYISGYVISWFLVKYRNKTGIYFQRVNSFYKEKFSNKTTIKHSCSICDNLSCRRHQQNASVTPWKHLHISKELNSAVENFYEKILENFVKTWYTPFTDDTDFINELRQCFRYAVASVVNRILELDIPDIITSKLVPCAIKHVDDFLYMQQIAKLKNIRFNEVIMGKRLHVAATNRKSELEYLQHLSSALLVNILPNTYLKCRNYSVMMREILAGWVFLPLMDVMANPNIINSLVILAVTYKSKKVPKHQKEEYVEFLNNYITVDKKVSSFATNLNKIKNNTELLYAFMQFLKKQDNVNLLQFCLDVDDFNSKLLKPNLSKKQMEELHSDIVKLYNEYIENSSFNFISCPSSISNEFKNLINDVYTVDKLSYLSKLLYKAYDHTFTTLESNWLPQFFHSNEFYGHICGSKIVPTYSKHTVKMRKPSEYSNQSAVSKLSSGFGKIKGVLKSTQTVEGAFFPLEPQNVEDVRVDEMLLSECKTLFRDMSTWKITVPSYQASPSNKVIYFYVNVERCDILSKDSKKSWVVLRKDQDFYTLKSKLVEFHGEHIANDSPLPSRKASSSVDNRMIKYEEFLKNLLSKPTLRGSDLLHSFLTTEEDFSIFIAANASNIQDIGNIYQSVAHKLRKEKGQHLDPFMATFLNSTGAGKHKNEKLELAEEGEEIDKLGLKYNEQIPPPKTYRNHIFNDNFGIQHKHLKETMSGSFNPEGLCECVFYLLKQIFKVPNGILRLYAAICSVAQNLVDLSCKIMIDRKLKSGLCQSNLTYLIKQLETVIFSEHVTPTKEELEKRKQRAFEELEHVIPSIVKKLLMCDMDSGLKVLLEILQHPHYNKQLVYNLLDIVLIEMYPMLEKNEDYY
nr:unnamed protein product [Callosobruchus chinensis]